MKTNDFPSGSPLTGYEIPSIFDRLDTVGASWKAYTSTASSLWLFQSLRGREELSTFDHFIAHASTGELPAVSWVEPGFGLNDDHPPVHPMLGKNRPASDSTRSALSLPSESWRRFRSRGCARPPRDGCASEHWNLPAIAQLPTWRARHAFSLNEFKGSVRRRRLRPWVPPGSLHRLLPKT